MREGRDPTEAEKLAAVIASAALLANRRVGTTRRNLGKAQQEEAVRQIRIEARLNTAGIPMAFRFRTFDNFIVENEEQRYALDLAREFSESFWSKRNIT